MMRLARGQQVRVGGRAKAKAAIGDPVVACHSWWSGQSPHREVLTEARSCPSAARDPELFR